MLSYVILSFTLLIIEWSFIIDYVVFLKMLFPRRWTTVSVTATAMSLYSPYVSLGSPFLLCFVCPQIASLSLCVRVCVCLVSASLLTWTTHLPATPTFLPLIAKLLFNIKLVLKCAVPHSLYSWCLVSLLCAGLLPSVTIVSASHSSRFDLVFQFLSLMVNICIVLSLPSVRIWYTVMSYWAVMHWQSDLLLFHMKWVCICAYGYWRDIQYIVFYGNFWYTPLPRRCQ